MGHPRLAVVDGRATLVVDGGTADVVRVSDGRWSWRTRDLLDDWDRFWEWAQGVEPEAAGAPSFEDLGPPVGEPRQVFAIGLNYRAHAAEGGYDTSGLPQVFTKFPSCLAGPSATVEVLSPRLDWEVELVAVIGRSADRVPEERGWDHVAAVMVGQDISARDVQHAGAAPQWGLGKSYRRFGPTGPYLVDPSDLPDRDDLAIACAVNGETMQSARTSELIWSVPELVARLSSVCTLFPGDLVFTGTPAGVGNRRTPPRYLVAGDELVSTLEGVGELRNRFVPPRPLSF